MTSGSIFIGHYISVLLSPAFSTIFGSSFLIILGIYNIYKILNSPPVDYDIDNSTIKMNYNYGNNTLYKMVNQKKNKCITQKRTRYKLNNSRVYVH